MYLSMHHIYALIVRKFEGFYDSYIFDEETGLIRKKKLILLRFSEMSAVGSCILSVCLSDKNLS